MGRGLASAYVLHPYTNTIPLFQRVRARLKVRARLEGWMDVRIEVEAVQVDFHTEEPVRKLHAYLYYYDLNA